MDVGPLGYLSIAAHGHADALAVTLSLDGREIVGDPGAASYYGHPEWRRVHRGTRVHATVTVDGEDQSVMGGPFMWTRKARVRVRSTDLGRGIVDAEHDGYRRLTGPVIHRRWLVAPPGHPSTLVVDLVEGEGEHEVRASWPLAPGLDVREERAGRLVSRDGVPVLEIVQGASTGICLEQVRGDTQNHLGWWSERLETRTPSWLVSGVCRGPVPLAIATVLRPPTGRTAPAAGGVTVEFGIGQIFVVWHDGIRHRELVIDTSQSGGVTESEW
jgi:hypothetical protein